MNTVEGFLSVRPDILIHSRINDQVDPQHLLIVEAKKGNISDHDINKIHGFISDNNYNYLLADLYYYNGTDITRQNIERPKAH